MKLLYLFAIIVSFICVPAQAQQNGMGNYTPPPLFQTPKIPEPEERKSNNIVPQLPVISPNIESIEGKNDGDAPLIRGRIFKETPDDTPAAAPTFYATEEELEKEAEKLQERDQESANTNEDKVESRPVPHPTKKPVLAAPVVKEQQGVVKGPKTMPAVKKKNVDAEVVFETEEKPALIIERVKDDPKEPEAAQTVIPAATKGNAEPVTSSFKEQPDGSRMLTMPYQPTVEKISVEQMAVIDQAVIPALDVNPATHILIQSYASPLDGVLSGDRRISLSRALTIRDYLLKQAIAADRVDVRSLGDHGNGEPRDRVELYLIN